MGEEISDKFATTRRMMLAAAIAIGLIAFPGAAQAATPAEQYVLDNVQKGTAILTDKSLTKEQRRAKCQDFLLGLIDLKAVSEYTLGQYRRGASPADLTAYNTAYKDYALAVYQNYFDKFTDQTLKVTGSYSPSSGDTVVKTLMTDPSKPGEKPLTVLFRVENAGGKFTVIDLSAEGVWLRQTQRDDFTGFLGQHGGDIKALIGVLKVKTEQVKTEKKKK
jgi:phospholipid transport system substrate-binding protein